MIGPERIPRLGAARLRPPLSRSMGTRRSPRLMHIGTVARAAPLCTAGLAAQADGHRSPPPEAGGSRY
ncbi:hypothetical protein ACP4OV_007991 [Aristida adscensionis]